MFIGNMVTEPIPARVFALYKIVANNKNGISKDNLKKLVEPPALDAGKTSYFSRVIAAAEELNIVLEDNNIVYINKNISPMKTIADFRFYVSGLMEDPNISSSQFYNVTTAIIKMSGNAMTIGKINQNAMLNALLEDCGNITETEMNGWRFWAMFFGFGYIYDMTFLPNSYVFLKNILKKCQFVKEHEIPFNEFLQKINVYYQHISEYGPDGTLNMGFSSALRQLNFNHEIRLINRKDRQYSWNLYPSINYFNDPVTDLVIYEY